MVLRLLFFSGYGTEAAVRRSHSLTPNFRLEKDLRPDSLRSRRVASQP
jgi:hypothetical protein